jgi:hypothetical protein
MTEATRVRQTEERLQTILKAVVVGARAGDPASRPGGEALTDAGQIHSIKRRVLTSGKVSFDAERTSRGGHADRFWAIALACQKERGPAPKTGTEIGVRVVG